MRLSTTDAITKTVARSPVQTQPSSPAIRSTNESETCSVSENHPFQSQDYLQIVARATNDAVRDLDLKSGRLYWPQGLKNMLGYDPAETKDDTAFWKKNIHPEDLGPTISAIQSAIESAAEQWSGE